MSLPRFILPAPAQPEAGQLLPLPVEPSRHLAVLRLRPGDPLELVLPCGPWRAELAEPDRSSARVRLVGPLEEDREAPVPLELYLPVTSHPGLLEEVLPPLVELGATRIQPVIYARSQYDPRRGLRLERLARIVQASCEQSHRSRLPELGEPLPFQALLEVETPQKWVAYEVPTGQPNPGLRLEGLALTSGPEGGIREDEFQELVAAGWGPLSLGNSILRAVTAPVAMLGAARYLLQGMR